ncbi:MAG: hypothetical protein ABMA64_32265 [Myxococcota bacterium]
MIFWGLAAACRPDGPAEHAQLWASQGWSALIPSVATVSFAPPEGARSWVEYGRGDALDLATPPTDAHSIAVLGLASGVSYRWRVVSERGGQRWESAEHTLEVPLAPPSVPRLLVQRADPEALAPAGFVLGSTANDLSEPTEGWVVIWNGAGEPVWWWRHEPGRLTTTTWVGATPGTVGWDAVDPGATGSRIHRARLDGTEIVTVDRADAQDAASEIEPGVLAWVGRDLLPLGAGVWINGDALFEAPIDGPPAPEPLVRLYDSFWGGSYTAPCDHPLTPHAIGDLEVVYELGEVSSLVAVPPLDALLVHVRWFDTTLLVDRATGDIVWRLGGPWSDFSGPQGEPLWTSPTDTLTSHGFLSDAWDGGMVMFDNGVHHDPPVASLVELAWDAEAHTVEEVRRFADPLGRSVPILGDARRLPDGHLLGAWSTLGELNEIDADGVERWRAATTPERAIGRVRWIADLYAP